MKNPFVQVVLAVVVVLGLLAVGGYVLYNPACRANLTRSMLQALGAKLEQFELDTGRFPTALRKLLIIDFRGRGPYAKVRELHDPWSEEFHYRVSADGNSFILFTLGRDKRLGGSGHDADLQVEFPERGD